MKRLIFLISIFVLLLINGNNLLISANFWKADGAKFVLDHPWLSVEDYAISSDTKILNVKSQSDSLYQFDMETGELLKSFVPSINSISKDWKFSEDGDNLISARNEIFGKVDSTKIIRLSIYKQQIISNFQIDSNKFDVSFLEIYKKNQRIDFNTANLSYKYFNNLNLFVLNTMYFPTYISGFSIQNNSQLGFEYYFRVDQKLNILQAFFHNGANKLFCLDKKSEYFYNHSANEFKLYGIQKPYLDHEVSYSNQFFYVFDYKKFDTIQNVNSNFPILKYYFDSTYLSYYNIDSNQIVIQNIHKNLPILNDTLQRSKINMISYISNNLIVYASKNSIQLNDIDKFTPIKTYLIGDNIDTVQSFKFNNSVLVVKTRLKLFKIKNNLISNDPSYQIVTNSDYFTNEDTINCFLATNDSVQIKYWQIGDEKFYELSPKIQYNKVGIFDLKVLIKNKVGLDTLLTKKINISLKLVPDFSVNKTDFKINEEVKFENKCNGNEYTLFWDFGDGTTSNEFNPIHKYSKNGNYSIKLVIKDQFFQDSIYKDELINIDKIPNEKIFYSFKENDIFDFYLSYFPIYSKNTEVRKISSNYNTNNNLTIFNINLYLTTYYEQLQQGQPCRYNRTFHNVEQNVFFKNINNKVIYLGNFNQTSNSVENDFLYFQQNEVSSVCNNEFKNLINNTFCQGVKILSHSQNIKEIESFKNEILIYDSIGKLTSYDTTTKLILWSLDLQPNEILFYKSHYFKFNCKIPKIIRNYNIRKISINGTTESINELKLHLNDLDSVNTIDFNNNNIYIAYNDSNILKFNQYDLDGKLTKSLILEDYTSISQIFHFKDYKLISGPRKQSNGFVFIDTNFKIVKSLKTDHKLYFDLITYMNNKLYLLDSSMETYLASLCYYYHPKIERINIKFLEITNDLDEFLKHDYTTIIQEINTSPSTFSIYPNPAQEQLYIQNICKGKLEILNVFGQQVMEFEIKEDETNKLIDLSTLAKGIYLVQTCQGIQKFVKE